MIAIDATPLQSEHRFRGVGAYTRQLCEQLLTKIPDEVRFLATKNGLDSLSPTIQAKSTVGSRGHRPAQLYWVYNELYLRQMLGKLKPSLFHATDFNGTLRLPGIPTVATLYDLTNVQPSGSDSSLSTRLSNWRWDIYYHKKLPQVDHLIAISQYVKDDAVATLGIAADHISVIPLGIDTAQFYPARGTGLFAGRAPYVLYVGSRDPNKNLESVLAAFGLVATEIADVRLAIAGRWNPSDEAWLQQRIDSDPSLHGRVDHLGFVSDADMASLYSNAEVFIFPSLAEGFGFPVLEAMACNTPVVASNRPPIPEVAGDSALLIDPLDPQAIATAILSILNSTARRNDLIQRGQTRARLYDWEKVAEDTIAVYRTLGGL